jgi:hypothetical protein
MVYRLQDPVTMTKELWTSQEIDQKIDERNGMVYLEGMSYLASCVLKEIDPATYDIISGDIQEYVTVYECPICGGEYEDYDEAVDCCQTVYECEVCGEQYDNDDEAISCCYKDEDEDEYDENEESTYLSKEEILDLVKDIKVKNVWIYR